jgi:hypothetical protein
VPMSIERRKLLAASLLMLVGCGGPKPCSISGTIHEGQNALLPISLKAPAPVKGRDRDRR